MKPDAALDDWEAMASDEEKGERRLCEPEGNTELDQQEAITDKRFSLLFLNAQRRSEDVQQVLNLCSFGVSEAGVRSY